MLQNSSYCRLLCASASAYYVQLNGHFAAPSTTDKDYPEYANVGFISTPLAFANVSSSGQQKINAAILGETDMGYILAFRGTLPPTTWNPATIEDWWQDICKVGEVSDPVLPGLVHEGFHTAFMSIWPAIKITLDNIYIHGGARKPLLITGHSKGGPMASYAAYYAKQIGYPLGQVTTFASPYAGNSVWASGYNAEVYQDRYENYLDIVPWLPPNKDALGKIIPKIDDFIDILEYIGFKKELEKFKHFLNRSLALDYTPVGHLHYIMQNHSITTPQQTPDLTGLRIAEFEALLIDEVLKHGPRGAMMALQVIGDAHSIGYGGGYETGVCNL